MHFYDSRWHFSTPPWCPLWEQWGGPIELEQMWAQQPGNLERSDLKYCKKTRKMGIFSTSKSTSTVPKKMSPPWVHRILSQENGSSQCSNAFSQAICSCAVLEYHKMVVGAKFLVRKLLWMVRVPFQISKKNAISGHIHGKTKNLKWPPFRHFWSDNDPPDIKIFRRASTLR